MSLLPTGCWGSLLHLTLPSHLCLFQIIFPEASVTAGSAAFVTEVRKHQANDRKCAELGWVSIHLWLRRMGAGVQRPSGLYCSLPPV